MIPAFNDFGLLPPGIHSCSLEQFQHVFAFNVRRQQLFESLTQCLQSMHRESLTGAVLLDGSYATDKQDPSDVEVVLDVRQQERADQDKALVFLVRQRNDPTRGVTLVMLSLATSLDALVVGVSLALSGISVWYPSVLIGLITAGVCFVAVRLGNHLRFVLARWAEVAGGLVLLLMAGRIVLGHLR